jgi:hypothetical protein
MKDISVSCVQCGNQFILTSHEQERLIVRGFDIPKRCPDCRKHKSRNAHDAYDEWDYMRKRKQSRREKDYFEEEEV